jgi:hypothetical protein
MSYCQRTTRPRSHQRQRQHQNQRQRRNICSLCKLDLQNTSFSDHYCRSNIPIKSGSYIKNLLRKENPLRQQFPEVQHVWAQVNPENPEEYLVKIKAPLDRIDTFLQHLEETIEEKKNNQESKIRDSPSPSNLSNQSHQRPQGHHSQQVCLFYNSPDGCKNENCSRLHIDNQVEKKRLLKLKEIIDGSKELNGPIKAFQAHLELAQEETQELNEAIQQNFENHLRQPTESQIFYDSIRRIQDIYRLGFELGELRAQLKQQSWRCYTNPNPQLLQNLRDTIQATAQLSEEIPAHQLNQDEMFDLSHNIYREQFLFNCRYVL